MPLQAVQTLGMLERLYACGMQAICTEDLEIAAGDQKQGYDLEWAKLQTPYHDSMHAVLLTVHGALAVVCRSRCNCRPRLLLQFAVVLLIL